MMPRPPVFDHKYFSWVAGSCQNCKFRSLGIPLALFHWVKHLVLNRVTSMAPGPAVQLSLSRCEPHAVSVMSVLSSWGVIEGRSLEIVKGVKQLH